MDRLSLHSLVVLALSLALFHALRLWLEFRGAAKAIGDHPGIRTVLHYATITNDILPRIRGFSVGRSYTWDAKHSDFQRVGWDILSMISAWPKARTMLVLADATAIKEVMSSRARFPKPVEHYTLLLLYGGNIVASEGEEWKKYRKISAPAFSDRNNKLVWDETIKIMRDMFESVWGNQDEVYVDHCADVTLQIALLVISVAGFGRRVSWNDDVEMHTGHRMTFKKALHTFSEGTVMKLIFPTWAMRFHWRLREIQLAFQEVEKYMLEMIQARESSEKVERYDLFSSLLDAHEEDVLDGGVKLKDGELIGNIFIFLLAGHETTAHTLCLTLALLALYPDEQDTLYRHTKDVLPVDRLPTIEDMPLFAYSSAVLYETLRMFPPVPSIPKRSAEDTVLTGSNASGDKTPIPVAKGTLLLISTPARYWEDPHTFKPSRFLADWPREAFIPFSAGARACLGRKFFETSGIAILTMLISRYKIEVKEEPQFANESFEERKTRLLMVTPGLTLTPTRVPLVFKRRY